MPRDNIFYTIWSMFVFISVVVTVCGVYVGYVAAVVEDGVFLIAYEC